MIRTPIIIVFTIFWTILMGLLAISFSPFSRKGNAIHIVGRIWGRGILEFSRIRVSVHGLSNLAPGQSYIFMSNHQSNFDIPVLIANLKTQFRWLAKAELFRIPIFGRAMRSAGYISIDRSNRRSAIKSLKIAAKTIRDGVSVVIFPEGTRSSDGRILPFKKGGFVLAVDSGVPILPVVIKGTWPIMPRDTLRIRPGRVTLEILEPIPTADYSRKEKELLMERVRETIVNCFEKETEAKTVC